MIRCAADKNDDFHRTRSKPDGSAVIGALRQTFDDAGMHPDEIEYINAHGTGTPENDNKGNLADRIRALQTRASRVQQQN